MIAPRVEVLARIPCHGTVFYDTDTALRSSFMGAFCYYFLVVLIHHEILRKRNSVVVVVGILQFII